jgi:hypothetical protein
VNAGICRRQVAGPFEIGKQKIVKPLFVDESGRVIAERFRVRMVGKAGAKPTGRVTTMAPNRVSISPWKSFA